MSLTDFFRINMPYGIVRNDKKEWKAFNREYVPLGWNEYDINRVSPVDEFLFTKYKGASEAALLKIAGEESRVHRNDKGEIVKIFFYNDGTNPQSSPKHWPEYMEKMKQLSTLTR